MATPQQLFLQDPSSLAALQLKTLGGDPLAGSSVRDAAFGSLFGQLGGSEIPTEARNRQFLLRGLGQEAELALRGLSSSGAGSFVRENLEQDRLNAILPAVNTGGGGGGRGRNVVDPKLFRPETPKPRGPGTRRVKEERDPIETPGFIKDLRAALQKSQAAEARQIGQGPRPEDRPQFGEGGREGRPRHLSTSLLGGDPTRQGTIDLTNPETAFRSELARRTENPAEKSQVELAGSIVGAFNQAQLFDTRLQELEEQFREPIEALEGKLRTSRDMDVPIRTDKFGNPLVPSGDKFSTRATRADVQELAAAREEFQQQRQQLQQAKLLQLERVQKEFKAFEGKLEAVQKMAGDSDKRAIRIFMRRGAKEVADFLGAEDKGGIKGYQAIMASSNPQAIMKARALIQQGVSVEQVKEALQEQPQGAI